MIVKNKYIEGMERKLLADREERHENLLQQ